MAARRVVLVLVLSPRSAPAPSPRRPARGATWLATPASVLKSALRGGHGARSATTPPTGTYAASVDRLGLRPDAGVRLDILGRAPAAGRAGRCTRASPAGAASSSWARSPARSRPVPTATGRWPAKRVSPCATGCARHDPWLLRSAPRPRAGPAGHGSPGRGNGGRARCRRAPPSCPSSPRSARSPAPSRCAGSASCPPRTPPGPSATPFSSPPRITDAHGGVLPRRERGLDQHRHVGGLRG